MKMYSGTEGRINEVKLVPPTIVAAAPGSKKLRNSQNEMERAG